MRLLSTVVALLTSTLVACGGGGGGDSDTSTTEFPVEAVFANAFTTSSSYTTTARDSQGNVFGLVFSITPGPTTTNPSISPDPKSTALITVSVNVNGGPAVSDTTELYFTRSPFSIAGSVNNTSIFGVTQSATLPATARIGASGVFASGTITDGATSTTQTMTWLLESDPLLTAAWLCLLTQENAADGQYIEKDCFRIDQGGNVSGFKTDVTMPGLTLQFR